MDNITSCCWLVNFLTGSPLKANFLEPITLDDVFDAHPNAISVEPVSTTQESEEPRPLSNPNPTEVVASPSPWQLGPRAWVQNWELRTIGVFDDLAAEIVKITSDDMDLQRKLLVENCQTYGPAHIYQLVEKWKECAAIMEYDGDLSREHAEEEAARQYNLLAFLPEIRCGTLR